MSSCEKCWRDSRSVEDYHNLLHERRNSPCTPEEQAGKDAQICPFCGKRTVHQFTGECMVQECKLRGEKNDRKFNCF